VSLFLLISCKEKDENITPNTGFSQETIQRLDFIIDSIMMQDSIPAVIAGIWIEGKGSYIRAKGRANLQEGTLVDAEDQYRIGSISKTFTGLRVLQLYDENQLDINEPISVYYPNFPNAENITIKNLLHMQSGMTDFAGSDFLEQWYHNPQLQLSISEELQLCANDSIHFYAPGNRVVYNNTNYIMLGDIICKVTGNSLQQEFYENIFQALGMSHTFYPNNDSVPGQLHGYGWNASIGSFDDMTILNPHIPNAAGGMISNLYDLKIFVKALYEGALISDSLHQQQIQYLPFDGDPSWFGYGMGILNFGGFWGHNGTIFGYSSEMFYNPELKATIVINANRLDINDQSKSSPLFTTIVKALFPEYISELKSGYE